MGTLAHTHTTDMKYLVILAFLGCTFAAPSELVAPLPVVDTEEVAAAKEAHAIAYAAAAAAAEADAVPEVVNQVGAPLSVVDTDEVAEAKAEFNAVLKAAGDDGVVAVGEYSALSPLTYGAHALSPFGLSPAVAPIAYHHAAIAPAVAPIANAHHAVAPLTVAPNHFAFAHAPLVL